MSSLKLSSNAPAGCEILPIETEFASLSLGPAHQLFFLSPVKGKEETLNTLLQSRFDVTLPGTQGASSSKKHQLLWCMMGTYFLICPEKSKLDIASEVSGLAFTSEVTDGWCQLVLDGPGAEEVLARLVSANIVGMQSESVAISELLQLRVHIYRKGSQFHLRVERSYSRALIERLNAALQRNAATKAFTGQS